MGTMERLAKTPNYPAALEEAHDISVDTRHVTDVADADGGQGTATAEAQFVAVKHAVSAAVPWEWRGGALYVSPSRVD